METHRNESATLKSSSQSLDLSLMDKAYSLYSLVEDSDSGLVGILH